MRKKREPTKEYESESVTIAVVKALVEFRDRRAVGPLKNILIHSHPYGSLRKAVVKALVEFGDERSNE